MRSLFCALAATALLVGSPATAAAGSVSAAATAAADQDVRAAVSEFVSSFNALDQARFDALWANDATVFFPQHPFPIRRVDGKVEVLTWFKLFMDSQRTAGKSPGVDPKEVQVQMAGPDAAIVSFHLGSDPAAVARRTLVYRREAGSWRIVHLHGSALTAKKP